MKTILPILFFMLCILSYGNSQENRPWEWQNPLPSGISYMDLHFFDKNNGIVIGEQGTILYTEDGGTNWRQIESISRTSLLRLFFVDRRYGWAVGVNGEIYRTRNAGLSWEAQSSPVEENLKTVFFIDRDNGWAAGRDGTIIYTNNGGASWNSTVSITSQEYRDIFFTDLNNGWAVGTRGVISRTVDGGKNWNVVSISTSFTSSINAIHFIQPDTAYLIGLNGTVLEMTVRSEIELRELDVPYSSTLLSFHFLDDNSVFTLSNEGVITDLLDGNSSVDIKPIAVNAFLENLYFVDEQTGWVVGEDGTLFRTQDGGENWEDLSKGFRNDLFDVSFVNERTGWVVGTSGTIYKTADGGNQWVEQNNPIGGRLWDIHMIDEQEGWIVGEPGVVLKTTNAGTTWVPIAVPDNARFRDVHFINKEVGFLVGGQGYLLKTNNGGDSWILQNKGSNFGFNTVFFIDEQKGWAAGTNNVLVVTENGGNEWNFISVSDIVGQTVFNDIVFVDDQHGWIAGEDGNILHTKDGGNSWETQNSGITRDLYDIHFVDTLRGWAVGFFGNIIFTEDGGLNWSSAVVPSTKALFGISAIGTKAWACGNGGSILHFELNRELPCRLRDSLALVDLYQNANGPDWDRLNWDLSKPISSWLVSSSDLSPEGCVERLSLFDNNLSGILPDAIGEMKNLKVISLQNNNLRGPIPESIYSLPSLRSLNLSSNQFSDSISPQVGQLINIETLLFNDNQLEGNIPDAFEELVNLENLDFSSNQLTGAIPTSFGNLIDLVQLLLGDNKLNGSIPEGIQELRRLIILDLSSNQLEGNIPDIFQPLQNLNELDLSNNQLSGELPEGIADVSSLKTFLVNNNSLSGCYPVAYRMAPWVASEGYNFAGNDDLSDYGNFLEMGIGSCCRLRDSTILLDVYAETAGEQWFRPWTLERPLNLWEGVTLNQDGCVERLELSNNGLIGTLPVSFEGMQELNNLNLSYNLLSGSIPLATNQLSKLQFADFSFNELTTLPEIPLSPDTLGTLIVHHNFLSFNSIIPNLELLWDSTFYSPQNHKVDLRKIFRFGPCDTPLLQMRINDSIEEYPYVWYKDGKPILTGLGNSPYELDLRTVVDYEAFPGQYHLQLIAKDSVIRIDLDPPLQVLIPFNCLTENEITQTLCAGESFEVAGEVFDQNRPNGCVYIENFGECDEVYYVNLFFRASDTTQIDTTLCLGKSVLIGGTQFDCLTQNDRSQFAEILLSNSDGCDSLLQVMVNCTLCGKETQETTNLAFSPNGDGVNDQFILTQLFDQQATNKTGRLQIFNRLKQLVYEEANYGNDWEGLDLSGRPLPIGTYYYVLQFNDGQSISGLLTIER